MRELFVLLERLAVTELDILIQGEPGTGTRLTAEAVHRRSGQRDGPLVFYDCGRDRDSTAVEVALFGSKEQPSNLVRQAGGGTLVLRRIEDLPRGAQARLLDLVLAQAALRESPDARGSGGVRFVFLSTLDLSVLTAEGLFFDRLYEKIAEVSLRIPPLRERKDDPAFLLEHFLVDFSPERFFDLSPDARLALSLYSFPGNVRELRGVVLRAIDHASGQQITRRDLLLGTGNDLDGIESLARTEFRAAAEGGRRANRWISTTFAVCDILLLPSDDSVD